MGSRWNLSDKTKNRMSESHKGLKLSEETKNKISISNKGRTYSAETKEKMRKAKIGKYYGADNPFYGEKHSEEMKTKLSMDRKIRYQGIGNPHFGKHLSEESKSKISKANKGRKYPNRKLSKETKDKIRIARLKQIIPSKDTRIEIKMQNILKEKGIKFETHKAILGQPDIFIEPNICIFCDGDYWHANPSKYRADDIIKTGVLVRKIWDKDNCINKSLEYNNYIVLRFWEHDINNNIDNCRDIILENVRV